VGLAGRPEESDAFLAFRAESTDIYVARDIWEHMASEAGRMSAYRLCALMPGYDVAWFRFEHCDEESTL
jgi:hypothetical protein